MPEDVGGENELASSFPEQKKMVQFHLLFGA